MEKEFQYLYQIKYLNQMFSNKGITVLFILKGQLLFYIIWCFPNNAMFI